MQCLLWARRLEVPSLLFSRSVVSDSCDPMNHSLPGSSVHGILQARILEFLLQGIFLTQGSNLHLLLLLHWQADSFVLCYQGSPHNQHDSQSKCNWIPGYWILG